MRVTMRLQSVAMSALRVAKSNERYYRTLEPVQKGPVPINYKQLHRSKQKLRSFFPCRRMDNDVNGVYFLANLLTPSLVHRIALVG